jgi:glutamate/tyrosine decarboxylase-like PLP-dependent enzyme
MSDGLNHTKRVAPLAMGSGEFRATGYQLIDRIADFLDSLEDSMTPRPVNPAESPVTIREALGAERRLPEGGEKADVLLQRAADLLFDHSLFNGHPRFWGYITSSAAPIGALADMLAAAVNPNVGAWALSPMASEIEAQTLRWIAELLHYPIDSSGLMVSGGNMANLVCLTTARRAKAGPDVRTAGLQTRRWRMYCSQETHTWIQKAADILGLGTDSIRWITTNQYLQIDTQALRKQIAEDLGAGDHPFLVVGTAGTVSTGAIDPLGELAAICREFDLWFHVDGAYGAMAALLPDAPAELERLCEADSLAVDPHKWLYAPLEAGCAFVRRRGDLENAFCWHPPYYHFGTEATNYYDLGPQNSRGFRDLKVWLSIQQAGRKGYAQMISDDIGLAREFFERIRVCPELQPLTQSLSIATFRFVPADLDQNAPDVKAYLDKLNRELLTRLQNSGEVYLSNAVIDGKFALRICIVNFRTTGEDIWALPHLVVRFGKVLDGELRESHLGCFATS